MLVRAREDTSGIAGAFGGADDPKRPMATYPRRAVVR